MNKINWIILSGNPNAISLLEKYTEINYCNDGINYISSLFKDPNVVYLSERNHFFWNFLSYNPNAIHLLEQNKDKILLESLSENPNAIHLLNKIKIKLSGVR